LPPFYDEVQASRHAGVPIFLNLYDTPVARNAPAFPGGRSWLFEAYRQERDPAAALAGPDRAPSSRMSSVR
jgi:hypothetical protein